MTFCRNLKDDLGQKDAVITTPLLAIGRIEWIGRRALVQFDYIPKQNVAYTREIVEQAELITMMPTHQNGNGHAGLLQSEPLLRELLD